MNIFISLPTRQHIDKLLITKPHAVAFTGEKGAGKGYLASWYASKLLGSRISETDSHPYIYLIKVKEIEKGIEAIRKIKEFLALKVPGKVEINRVVIIEDFELLRQEAQNALLKIIEEPPERSCIVLSYSRQDKVLSTIKSRVTTVNVQPVGIEEFKKEALFNTEELKRTYLLTGGLAGKTTEILSKHPDSASDDYLAKAREIISMSRYERLNTIDSLLKDKNIQIIELIESIYQFIQAGFKNKVKASAKNMKQLNSYISKLELIDESVNDLRENVQPKLVLNRLFLSL